MFRPLKTYQVVVDISVAAVFFVLALGSSSMVDEARIAESSCGRRPCSGAVAIALMFSRGARRPPAGRRRSRSVWRGRAPSCRWRSGRPPTASDVAIFGVLYVTAAYGTRRIYWAGFASALVGALVITVYVFLGPSFAAGGLRCAALPLAVAVLIAAAFALLLCVDDRRPRARRPARPREPRRAQERAEAEAVVRAGARAHRARHARRRRALARRRDRAGRRRAVCRGSGPAAATRALETISTTARAALADVRLLLGAAAAQRRATARSRRSPTSRRCTRRCARSGVDLRVTVDPAPPAEPPAGVQLAVYRILQEALTNALRHGRAAVEVRPRVAP